MKLDDVASKIVFWMIGLTAVVGVMMASFGVVVFFAWHFYFNYGIHKKPIYKTIGDGMIAGGIVIGLIVLALGLVKLRKLYKKFVAATES